MASTGEARRRYAAALQLEQEPQPGAEELVEVVDAESREGVRIERGGFAAAQARHQPLFEQALPGLVKHPELAGRSDQVSELVEKARADAVESPDPGAIEDLRPQIRPARHQLIGDPRPQLVGGALVEGDRQDLAGRDSMLDQPAETFGRGGGLARARSRGDEKSALWAGVGGSVLLGAERSGWSGNHSGGAPP